MNERAIIIRNVPEDLRRDLKIAAIQEGETMQGLIVRVLTEWRDGRKKWTDKRGGGER